MLFWLELSKEVVYLVPTYLSGCEFLSYQRQMKLSIGKRILGVMFQTPTQNQIFISISDCPYSICLCRISYGNASWTPSICPCPPPWGLQNSTQTICLCIWSQWWILRHQFRQKRNSGNFDFLFSFWMWKHKVLCYFLMLPELENVVFFKISSFLGLCLPVDKKSISVASVSN